MPGVMQFLQSIFFVLISVGFVWQLPAAEHSHQQHDHQQHDHWQNEEVSFSAFDLRLVADIPVQINRGYAGRLFSPLQAGDQRRINKSGRSTSKLVDHQQDQQPPADATVGQSRDINLDGGHVARGVATLTPPHNAGNIGWLSEHDLQATYRQQRYEHPMIARFYSNDPVGFTAANPKMFNRYAYANNNPYKFTDPDGRLPVLIPVVAFVAKEIASEAVEQVTGVPMPTVKNVGKAAMKAIGKDTTSETRKQALNQARKMNAVPKNAKMQQLKPNTPEGKAAGLDNRNVRAYQTENTNGDKVTIREDKAASYGDADGQGDQKPHFNVEVNGVDTKQHHNWETVD